MAGQKCAYHHHHHHHPISFRIDYKIATLAYKVLKTHSPYYLGQLVHFYTPSDICAPPTDIV